MGLCAASCGLLAFLLGTVGRPTPTRAMRAVRVVDRSFQPAVPSRPRVLQERNEAPRNDAAIAPVQRSIVIRLGTDLRLGMTALPVLDPEWDPERVWPLPDELPDDPILFALQDALLATDDTRDAALDALDAQLGEAGNPASGWVALAHLEAERLLEKAAYASALDEHNDALWSWADGGGLGPMPEPPQPWSSAALGKDARTLARDVDGWGQDPALGDLARLTAASAWLDWTAEPELEAAAGSLLIDVIDHSNDPEVLAGAVDLLVGSRVDLSAESLDELTALMPELSDQTARRLAGFLSGRFLEQGDSNRALEVLEVGLLEGIAMESTESTPILEGLQRTRATLIARLGGPIDSTADAMIDALAWQCWLDLQTNDDRWVVDGTDYAGTLLLTKAGARWIEWTDQNPHQDCMVEEVQRRAPVAERGVIEVTFALQSGP